MRSSLKFNKIAALALISTLAVAPHLASAATATGSLAVTATVVQTCLVATTPLVFGNYSLGAVDVAATVIVTCTPDVASYSVALGAGANGATTTTRKMKLATGADLMNYALYRDAGRTQNWGETIGVDTVSSTGPIATYTVYGQLPGSQTGVAPGLYSDTVAVTVTY